MKLEEIEKQWKEDWPYHAPVYINWLINRVKELEKGISEHKWDYDDRKLHKLLEK